MRNKKENMVSGDILGYPTNAFRRMWLEHYWRATFGATDIGVPDFPTLEEFLRNNADRTYEDSKRLLLSFASSDVLADLKSISDEEARLESAEEEHLVEELSKVEVGEMALDKIRRQKEENERLKAEVAELKKRKARAKSAPKPKPLEAFVPPVHPQSFPPVPRGKDYDWLLKIITADGLDDLELASREIILPTTELTEQDRKELQALLQAKRKELQKTYKSTKQIMKPVPIREPISKIRTFRDVIGKREKEEPEVPQRRRKQEEEYTREEARITEMAGTARADTAHDVAEQLKSHLSEIIQYGLREYIQKNNIDVPVNNVLLAMLAEELISIWFTKVREPANVRETIGQAIVKREGVMLLASGIEYIKDSNTMRQMYELAKAGNKNIPDFDVVVKDVTKTILMVK